jgi:hypothetical protein
MPCDYLALSSLQTRFAKDHLTPRNILQAKSLNLPLIAFGNLNCISFDPANISRWLSFLFIYERFI